MRKLLKTNAEERSVHTNSESCNIIAKNQFISKQMIQILQTIVIDYFSTHSCIVDIFFIFFYDQIVTFENIYSVSRIFDKKQNQKYYEILTFHECAKNNR